MGQTSYLERRSQIEAYFDRTAADAWARLTSDAPVSGVRATVRAGREQMRQLLVGWVASAQEATHRRVSGPTPAQGVRSVQASTGLEPYRQRSAHHGEATGFIRDEQPAPTGGPIAGMPLYARGILDAGCGTGLLAVDCARLGASVTAIDLSPTLVDLARERLPADLAPGSVRLLSGDMLDPALGEFDHLVAMDSLIHYAPEQAVSALVALAPRIGSSMVFTFAPGSLPLRAMIAVGRLFPRGDRSPSIIPVAPERMQRLLGEALGPLGWRLGRSQRVSRGFYTSQAQELVRR